MKKYHYACFGFSLEANFELNSLPLCNESNEAEFVLTKSYEASSSTAESRYSRPKLGGTRNELFYKLDILANFYLTNKKQISIVQFTDDNELVECQFVERVLPFFLQNLGHHLFKGAAISIDNKAHVFFGNPGIGLSALMAKFAQLGYPIISDSWLRLSVLEGNWSVFRSNSYLKLWSPDITNLKLQPRVVGPVRQNLSKFYVELSELEGSTLVELASINHMAIMTKGEFELDVESIQSMRALELMGQFYNPLYMLNEAQMRKEKFKNISNLISNFKIKKFVRPTALFEIDEHANFILNNINE